MSQVWAGYWFEIPLAATISCLLYTAMRGGRRRPGALTSAALSLWISGLLLFGVMVSSRASGWPFVPMYFWLLAAIVACFALRERNRWRCLVLAAPVLCAVLWFAFMALLVLLLPAVL